MSKATRGFQKNNFDIWVACDASPHMDTEHYRTWFYFSVTGVPQGELVTFTFKNLNNQVSEEVHNFCYSSNPIILYVDKIIQPGPKTSLSCHAYVAKEVEKTLD